MSSPKLCSLLRITSPMAIIRIPNSLSLSLLRFAARPSPSPSFAKILLVSGPSYAYSAIAAAETAIESSTPTVAQKANRSRHPWPEWVVFVDRLKSQGYFPQSSSPSNGADPELVYREMNIVKDPCLSFGRDRYDILGSLSKGDIQDIVEGGCPKILRKVVNSAKRLRVYVGLDESNVCGACSLQGSCDRAYVTLKESEQDARTVDLVRLLLFYALDPLVVSEAAVSQNVDQANSSARKLLRMLTDLGEASPALTPVQPPSKDFYQKKEIVPSKNVVMAQKTEMKKGDWMCPECNFMNFSRNVRCQKCNVEHPKDENANHVEMKRGNWSCPQCSSMNFASRSNCFRCKEPRPPRSMNPGEWECPKCDFLNFRRNINCLKCGSERVKEAVSQYEEQFWRRPQ